MKKRINKKNCFISPMCPEASRGRICTKLGAAIGAADLITCTNFLVIGQRVWILWGSKIAISHWQSQSPLTRGWRYRAARDIALFWVKVKLKLAKMGRKSAFSSQTGKTWVSCLCSVVTGPVKHTELSYGNAAGRRTGRSHRRFMLPRFGA